MPGSGDNQGLEIKKAIVNIDSALLATPVHKQFCLLAASPNENEQIEVLAIDYVARTIVIDGTDPVTLVVNAVDDSAADAETAIVSALDIKSTNTALVAKVARNIFRGSTILDPGDVLNAVITSTTPDTAGQGTALVVSYRTTKHS